MYRTKIVSVYLPSENPAHAHLNVTTVMSPSPGRPPSPYKNPAHAPVQTLIMAATLFSLYPDGKYSCRFSDESHCCYCFFLCAHSQYSQYVYVVHCTVQRRYMNSSYFITCDLLYYYRIIDDRIAKNESYIVFFSKKDCRNEE